MRWKWQFYIAIQCSIYSVPFPDSKVHKANIGPTWVLSAPDGPNVGPMNLCIGVGSKNKMKCKMKEAMLESCVYYDEVMAWGRLPHNWPFMMRNHRLSMVSTHKDVMMTSSNGNIFRVTGPLCGEFTGPGEFPTQRPVTRSFDVFFDLRLNKRLSKQPWGWWFETSS